MFWKFMTKVLQPAGGVGKQPPSGASGAPAGTNDEAAPPATPEKELERRFLRQLDAMANEASDRGMFHVFVEAATWNLAVIAYQCGPAATGDVVRRVGNSLYLLAETERAEREASEARREGRQPN